MKKQLTRKTVYVPNQRVKVTVVNTPIYDETGALEGYRKKVTLNYVGDFDKDELSFATDDAIADYFGAVDFTDPQQEMFN